MLLRARFLLFTLLVAVVVPSFARADGPAPRGFVVLSLPAPGAADVAWPLAHDVYTSAALRPAAIDEARARVLAGEPPAADAPREVRDLAETRAAVRGDDAPSRRLLAAIADELRVRGVVVVDPGSAPPNTATARVFLADTQAFDAARYAPDDAQPIAWHAAVDSLARAFAAPAVTAPPPPAPTTAAARPAAPAGALHEGPKVENMPSGPKKFYESAWFWGAIGAAVLLGAGVYFLTRDNTTDTIHLQMQVPH